MWTLFIVGTYIKIRLWNTSQIWRDTDIYAYFISTTPRTELMFERYLPINAGHHITIMFWVVLPIIVVRIIIVSIHWEVLSTYLRYLPINVGHIVTVQRVSALELQFGCCELGTYKSDSGNHHSWGEKNPIQSTLWKRGFYTTNQQSAGNWNLCQAWDSNLFLTF